MSSVQLTLYRRARRDGSPLTEAAEIARIKREEAALTDKDDAREPPAPDAFVLSEATARSLIGGLAETPLGRAAVERLTT